MKKKVAILGVLFFLTICSILLILINDKESELEKLPALMDASGKINITVGDFQLSTQPYIGDTNAPIKVIEFADFKCPACKQWELSSFPKFKQKFIDSGKVQFYFINFPFLGPDSIEAAVAAETVYNQNPEAFWDFKTKLYQSQGKEKTIWATEKFILKFARNNIDAIDFDLFKKDLKDHNYLLNVKKDFKISAANGIYGTPSFIVNGTRVDSSELENKILSLLE
ncbi:thioredoxin domain-containing protein [Paenibacillus tianjinensis]|uniref:DsbA family protein n=1 Tax=Paenibacillus tianjinensis TaxID=2810347 RepID=A0ABX7LC20_9BACL|nr:thioredoxin domain-containing protein [Paenibacillus tianjinensis]QSF44928.1 DsbA family protein [Paenibacillus tianjinensis]